MLVTPCGLPQFMFPVPFYPKLSGNASAYLSNGVFICQIERKPRRPPTSGGRLSRAKCRFSTAASVCHTVVDAAKVGGLDGKQIGAGGPLGINQMEAYRTLTLHGVKDLVHILVVDENSVSTAVYGAGHGMVGTVSSPHSDVILVYILGRRVFDKIAPILVQEDSNAGLIFLVV